MQAVLTGLNRLPAPWVAQALVLGAVFSVVTFLELNPGAAAFTAPLDEITATLSASIIESAGMPVSLDHVYLSHPSGFRFKITYACTGIVPVAILAASLLCFPLPARRRLAGLVTGAAILLSVNLLRIGGLYYIRANYPESFDVAHDWCGQTLLVAVTAVVILYWIREPAFSRG